MGCWWVGGRRGKDTGVQLAALMMRSASKKFLKSDATSRSCKGKAQHSLCAHCYYSPEACAAPLFGEACSFAVQAHVCSWVCSIKPEKDTRGVLGVAGYLSKEALEQAAGQHVPGDGVSDGGVYPIEFPKRRLAVSLLPGDPIYELLCQALCLQQGARAEPPQRYLSNSSYLDKGATKARGCHRNGRKSLTYEQLQYYMMATLTP